jgi:hypothetical protein
MMSLTSPKELSLSLPAAMEPAGTNLFGDIVCPHCGLNMVTPAGMVVTSGCAPCLRCGRLFTVSASLAAAANARAAAQFLGR